MQKLLTFKFNDVIICFRNLEMKKFLFGTILLLSSVAMADDNILVTDVAVRAGDQVIVFVDDIGRYVTVATEDDVKIIFDAEDVQPGKHEVLIRIVDKNLGSVKETKKTIEVK